jgi:hypothetical protein
VLGEERPLLLGEQLADQPGALGDLAGVVDAAGALEGARAYLAAAGHGVHLDDQVRRLAQAGGQLVGTTGRSFTTESPPLPWIRRARTTTPAPLRVSLGVSKKNT